VIRAKEELLLIGGGSYIRLNAQGIEYGTAKNWKVHSGTQGIAGPRSVPVPELPQYPVSGPYHGRYQLFKDDNRPFEGYRYLIVNQAGKVLREGKTDGDGWTDFVYTEVDEEIRAYKQVMRESERITEDWKGRFAALFQQIER
jgi:type VI secretion system secreted protein VgrG